MNNPLTGVDIITLTGTPTRRVLANQEWGQVVTALPAAGLAGDSVTQQLDSTGRRVIAPYTIPEQITRASVTVTGGGGTTTVLAAPGAGLRLYITSISMHVNSATVAQSISVREITGAINFESWTLNFPYEGRSKSYPTPIRCQINSGIEAITAFAPDVFVSVQGFIGR